MPHIRINYLYDNDSEKGGIIYLDNEVLLDLSNTNDSTDDILDKILDYFDYERHISIEYLHDEWECEDCGWTSAQGAIVYMYGNKILSLEPHAHCYGGDDYSKADIKIKILEHLGYTVELDS